MKQDGQNTFAAPNFAAPKKSLGQNFLQDPNIIRKIIEAVAIKANDTVIEIGPGRGALTEHILQLTEHCHVIEIDRDLIAYWQQRRAEGASLVVHPNNILKFDLTEIIEQSVGKVKVIGNLPYNISSPVLFHLMQYADRFESQTVMLQKEVVDRMAASPGNKQYGRLSVMLQQRYKIESLFKVPAQAFFPAPKVESAIAQLTSLDQQKHPVEDHPKFAALVKQAFSQRRKTLRNTLKGLIEVDQIEALGIDPTARAETLSVDDFARMSNVLAKHT